MRNKNLKINVHEKRGRPKTIVSDDRKEWLLCLFERPGISRQTPDRKNAVYIGKVDGVRQHKQKRYLQWTLQENLGIINGVARIQVGETFPERFKGKEMSLRALYNFI